VGLGGKLFSAFPFNQAISSVRSKGCSLNILVLAISLFTMNQLWMGSDPKAQAPIIKS